MAGEFEIIKTVRYPIGQRKFDLKEFLPQTNHTYGKNVKSTIFMKSVENFRMKKPFDLNEKISSALIGPMSFHGLEEAT
jgi:hypothetical protein